MNKILRRKIPKIVNVIFFDNIIYDSVLALSFISVVGHFVAHDLGHTVGITLIQKSYEIFSDIYLAWINTEKLKNSGFF